MTCIIKALCDTRHGPGQESLHLQCSCAQQANRSEAKFHTVRTAGTAGSAIDNDGNNVQINAKKKKPLINQALENLDGLHRVNGSCISRRRLVARVPPRDIDVRSR